MKQTLLRGECGYSVCFCLLCPSPLPPFSCIGPSRFVNNHLDNECLGMENVAESVVRRVFFFLLGVLQNRRVGTHNNNTLVILFMGHYLRPTRRNKVLRNGNMKPWKIWKIWNMNLNQTLSWTPACTVGARNEDCSLHSHLLVATISSNSGSRNCSSMSGNISNKCRIRVERIKRMQQCCDRCLWQREVCQKKSPCPFFFQWTDRKTHRSPCILSSTLAISTPHQSR